MNNFKLYNPTKIIFGKGEIKNINKEISKEDKILLLYGGGSIKENGIYNQIKNILLDYNYLEFGGVTSNPEYSTLLKALDIIKKENINFILAVGGGSVIDGAKFLSAAAYYKGENYWDILTNKTPILKGMPFGTILTLPATGSEMNSGAVITRAKTNEKLTMGGEGLFPKFSILDPQVVYSIPKRQISNGLADSFTHVLEQYVTYPTNALVQDRFSESIIKSILEIAPKILENQNDYKTASNFMWSCTMALNGLIQKGVPTDWVIHAIGHELTALYNIDHARTLAIITHNHYKYNIESKKYKLAQLAERVFDINIGDIEYKANKSIELINKFFKSLNIKTKLSDYTKNYKTAALEIEKRFIERGWLELGENKNISPTDVRKIVEMSC